VAGASAHSLEVTAGDQHAVGLLEQHVDRATKFHQRLGAGVAPVNLAVSFQPGEVVAPRAANGVKGPNDDDASIGLHQGGIGPTAAAVPFQARPGVKVSVHAAVGVEANDAVPRPIGKGGEIPHDESLALRQGDQLGDLAAAARRA